METEKNGVSIMSNNDVADFDQKTELELEYCPVCGEATVSLWPEEKLSILPKHFPRTHHRKCACERARDAAEQEAYLNRQHEDRVKGLLARCFSGNAVMKDMTFALSMSDNPAIEICRKYADAWETAKEENLGLLLWGDVGTGKSYMAACIANVLLEQEEEVRMLNLSDVMNATFEAREEILRAVRQCSLLILDDYGMERDNEYGNEIAFQVIDTRYQCRKPLIVTTNLSLDTLRSPRDLIHKRVYDRILEMCLPVQFRGTSLRPDIRKRKMERFREILNAGKGE